MIPRLPERIDLDDLVVRRYGVSDVPELAKAMRESLTHLGRWLSWATPEGVTEEGALEFIKRADEQFAARTDANFGIFAAGAETVVLGACGVHDRLGPAAVEIGYWLHVDFTGRGIMTRAVRAVGDLVLRDDRFDRVEIHCDEANTPSAAVPRRLGYNLEAVVPTIRPGGTDGSGRHQIWVRERVAESERGASS